MEAAQRDGTTTARWGVGVLGGCKDKGIDQTQRLSTRVGACHSLGVQGCCVAMARQGVGEGESRARQEEMAGIYGVHRDNPVLSLFSNATGKETVD